MFMKVLLLLLPLLSNIDIYKRENRFYYKISHVRMEEIKIKIKINQELQTALSNRGTIVGRNMQAAEDILKEMIIINSLRKRILCLK